MQKLSELKPGASAILREYPTKGTAFVRLREMGMLAGTPITFVRSAPLGDPIEVRIRGYNLTLRRSEADQVLVDPT